MNQGKGIFLLRSRTEIETVLAERDAKNQSNKAGTRPPMMRIVQRCVETDLHTQTHTHTHTDTEIETIMLVERDVTN